MTNRPTDVLTEAVRELSISSDGESPRIDSRLVLESVVAANDDLSAVRHPLGFMHFELTPLMPTTDRQRVRLHLWTSESLGWADGLGEIHDHNWELNSLVLVGELEDTVLRAVEVGDGSYVATQVTYGESGLEFGDEAHRFELHPEQTRVVTKGRAYRLNPGLLHFTRIKEFPTATLVQATMTAANTALVYRPRDSTAIPRTGRVGIPKSESKAALESALGQIDAS